MENIIRAPTQANSTIIPVGPTASPEQIIPATKNRLCVSSSVPFFIIFGLPGQVPVPTPATAFPLPAGTSLIVTSREANSFRVVTGSVNGRFGWQLI